MLDNYLANRKESNCWKNKKSSEDYIYNLTKDDGTTQNIKIIDKTNIHNNSLQVINQVEVEEKEKTFTMLLF